MPKLCKTTLNGYAVDIGGTKTAAAKIVNGSILARRTQPTKADASLANHIDTIAAMLSELGWQAGERLGVAVTGRLTAGGLWSAINSNTLSQLNNADLGTALQSRFGTAWVLNDALAATLAEYQFGNNLDESIDKGNFAYITVSTGVGGGLVCHSQLVQSTNGLAGSFGFMTSRHAHKACGSGRFATVESISSGSAIASAAADAGYEGLDARGVFAAASTGAEWAQAILESSAQAIAELCGNIQAMVAPSGIAIGGSVGLASGYLEVVRRYIAQEPALFQSNIMPAQLATDAPLLGALAFAHISKP